MLSIYLLGVVMIFKGIEIRLHLYLPDKDRFLAEYRHDFIIYDANAFLKFLSLIYLISGTMFILALTYYSLVPNFSTMLVSYGLCIYFIQLILTSLGKKYYKKRFS